VVHPSVKATTLAESVALAKSKNGEMNYGSAGLGSPQHLQAEFFNQIASLKSNHVPYKGQSQAMTDLVGGQLDYMFSPIQNALPFIQQGRIRAIAVAAPQRNPALLNVPSFLEGGYAGVDLSNWFAVYAPAGTPSATVKKLSMALAKIGATPDIKKV
jgi:tripartite-type tricarboxylate transporter receptor subunit TctC